MGEERDPLEIDAEKLTDAAGVDDSAVEEISDNNAACAGLIDRANRPWNTRPGPEDAIKRVTKRERLDDVVREVRPDRR